MALDVIFTYHIHLVCRPILRGVTPPLPHKSLRSFSLCTFLHPPVICWPGSVFGTATAYGLDGPGIESWWDARLPAPVQTGPGDHPASLTMGTGSFPGVKSGRDVKLTSQPLLVPWSWKGRDIPLLPLWVVRPVQSLSACTMVSFSFLTNSKIPKLNICALCWNYYYMYNVWKTWKLFRYRNIYEYHFSKIFYFCRAVRCFCDVYWWRMQYPVACK